MTPSPNLSLHRAFRVALVLLTLVSIPANAGQFALFGGKVAGISKTTMTIGSGYRAQNVTDPVMIGAGAGQTGEWPGATGAVSVNDDQDLNFPHTGDRYSAPATVVSELSLIHHSGQGVFVRVRGWYDMALKGEDVPHGGLTNKYTLNSRLSDRGMIGAGAFSGVDLYDAYYFANLKVGGSNMKVRLGRQAIDWGEGLFYPGINAVNPTDYAWLNMPGAPVLNGGKLPVNRVYFNWAGKRGWTLDGFFNLEFRPSSFPACGVYGQGVDNGFNPGCNMPTAAGFPDTTYIGTRNYYMGELPRGVYHPDGETNAVLGGRPMSGEPSQFSGWGVSAHKFAESLATEFGVYYTAYNSNNFPIMSAVAGSNPLLFSVNTNFPDGVEAFALSASTGLRNMAVHAQVTRTLNLPVHFNAPEYIFGTISGAGPMGWMKAEGLNENCPNGCEVKTHWGMDVTQLQYGGTWQFGQLVGLPDATLTAEVDMQWNTNFPSMNGPHAIRLMRFGNYGVADWDGPGYTCDPGPLESGVMNRCELKGFVTESAWGYKLRLATSFQRGPALTFVPALTWGQDIKGWSADGLINEDRWVVAFFLRTIIKQNYYIDLNAVRFNPNANWDPMKDNGQYTFAVGINF